jgi:hypothetical protein
VGVWVNALIIKRKRQKKKNKKSYKASSDVECVVGAHSYRPAFPRCLPLEPRRGVGNHPSPGTTWSAHALTQRACHHPQKKKKRKERDGGNDIGDPSNHGGQPHML